MLLVYPSHRNLARALIGVALLLPATAGAGDLALEIEIRAREIAPGEPLRVRIGSLEPLDDLRAELLGRSLFLVRETAPGLRPERWTGWAMIDLDRQPGLVSIEVHGRTASGRTAVGSRAITIADKPFPVEELSVAPRYVEPPFEVRERLAREREKLGEIYDRHTPPPQALRAFVRPVPGRATSIFGTRRVFNGEPRSPHSGLDLRAAVGDPVHASGAGRVVLAQDLYYSGKTVLIDHGAGLFTIYAHLSELLTAEGDDAEAGALIGKAGATGRVTGPHLHWGAKIGDRPFDPTALLDAGLWE